jgi:hypothetical protein
MLAVTGFLVGEAFHPLFGGNVDVPSYLAFQQTPLQTFWPIVVGVIGVIEFATSVPKFENPLEGGWWVPKPAAEAGDREFVARTRRRDT